MPNPPKIPAPLTPEVTTDVPTLGQAIECDAILLFDEADAIFGKRSDATDAHDRYGTDLTEKQPPKP